MDIAATCRRLSDFHGMLDLPERVRDTVDLQRQQRVALAQAAEAIDSLRARVRVLELALFDDGRDPTDCKDSPVTG